MNERLLTPAELAQLLGVSRRSIYLMVHKKRIPAVKISRHCLRFRQSEIEKWLKSKEAPALEVEPQDINKLVDRIIKEVKESKN
ncbi:MAG: helix-turn-helix transcriptional regulator [Thermodesulfovibrionales bacterium]